MFNLRDYGSNIWDNSGRFKRMLIVLVAIASGWLCQPFHFS
jgi:hypothetical protein